MVHNLILRLLPGIFLELEQKQWTTKILSTLCPWLKVSYLSNVISWNFFLLKVLLTEWLLRNFFYLLISVLVGPESHLIPFFPKEKFCLLHRNQCFFFFNSKSHSELLIYRLNFFSPLLPAVSRDQIYITTGLIDLEPIKSESIIANCNFFFLLHFIVITFYFLTSFWVWIPRVCWASSLWSTLNSLTISTWGSITIVISNYLLILAPHTYNIQRIKQRQDVENCQEGNSGEKVKECQKFSSLWTHTVL